MMNCIIVDDEPLAREGVQLNINHVDFLNPVGAFNNALSANSFLSENDVDLMFLDIQMPGITGLEFLDSLTVKPLVILTTAYPEFALKGFELDVVDYLLKPIRLSRFIKAANKANDIFNSKKTSPEPPPPEQKFIYVTADRKYVRLFFEDIYYIEGMKDYVILHTEEGKTITAMNLKTILSQLPATIFARVNKSYIINVNYVDRIESDFIILGKQEIPLGRSYKEAFFANYIHKNLLKR